MYCSETCKRKSLFTGRCLLVDTLQHWHVHSVSITLSFASLIINWCWWVKCFADHFAPAFATCCEVSCSLLLFFLSQQLGQNPLVFVLLESFTSRFPIMKALVVFLSEPWFRENKAKYDKGWKLNQFRGGKFWLVTQMKTLSVAPCSRQTSAFTH